MACVVQGAPGDTELVSVRLAGKASGGGGQARISANGNYVAFTSSAADLVPGDNNAREDVFVRNLQSGAIELISVGASASANADSGQPVISADGRYVAFWSDASNLVGGDTNLQPDIFVRDRQAGTTERVSVSSAGTQGENFSEEPAISADGRYVAFSSAASNLVAGDGNGDYDVFVRDRQTGTTELVSADSGGAQANAGASKPSISTDGRFVAFESRASNLAAGDNNGTADIFVRDRQLSQTELVSVDPGTAQPIGYSHEATISADGRYVAFWSDASSLTPGESNGQNDVFVRDRETGQTQLVNVNESGVEAVGFSHDPAISADGQFVAFWSDASNLVSGDSNGKPDIFVRAWQSGQTERVSLESNGGQADNASSSPSLSADGRFVAFESNAALLPGFGNGHVFVRDRQASTVTVASAAALYGAGAGSSGTDGSRYVSADGRYVVFWSCASDLVAGDSNGQCDVFIRDRQMGQTERISVASNGDQADSYSFSPAVSADGRYVAFWSNASNLVPGDSNAQPDIFVHDRQMGLTERVSVDSSGGQAAGYSFSPSMSGDGRFVAFQSSAANLVASDSNGRNDIFVRDRQSGQTERISVSSGGVQANNASTAAHISNDGRYVAFGSSASNLVPSDTNSQYDIFVRDRQTGQTERVSVSSGGVQANSASYTPAISDDGRFVAFWSYASNLVSSDGNGLADLFVRDRQTARTERASVSSSGVQANRFSDRPSISADGRFVAFRSYASNLVAGDTNNDFDIFVRDRSGPTERVSLNSSGSQANGASDLPSISADGHFVAFQSAASNLVTADLSSSTDVYIRERAVTAGSAIYTLTPGSLSFGEQSTNTASAALAAQVTNTGTVTLPISGIAIGGTNAGQFSRTTTCGASLAAGSSCQINVVFKPTSNGTKTANLTVTAGAGAGTKSVTLSGTGVATTFTLTPTSLSFGTQPRNTSSAPKVVTVANTGAAPLTIVSRTLGGANPGQFSQSTTCGASVPVGGSCTISVVFKPTGTGTKSATLTVQVGGGAASRTVTLSGQGI